MSSDFLIIGGGVIGLSIGRELHRKGAGKITVIDRGRCGGEASWAAAGMLSPQAEADELGPFFELCSASRDLYPLLAEELLDETGIDIELDRTGTLALAFTEQQQNELDRRYHLQSGLGLPVDSLSAHDVRALEPGIASNLAGGLFFAGDWQVENRKLVDALRKYCSLNGIALVEHTAVDEIVLSGDRAVGVRCADNVHEAETIILAAGAWSSLIKHGPMNAPFHIEPVRGQMISFESELHTCRHVVYGDHCYLVPRRGGRILAGSTIERAGYEKRTTGASTQILASAARSIVPALREVAIAERWSGLRPHALGDWPILGPSNIEGL
ncbi:MAG: glycine oxidase ThiO, partial [Acidobacteria bacterium]|nr:glycine oxidase ThiO [Acidobacteriota bacterium]